LKHKRKYLWVYLDGKKLVEVIQAALDNHKSIEEVKTILVSENPGHDVQFKISSMK
jgi:hypothetical protein